MGTNEFQEQAAALQGVSSVGHSILGMLSQQMRVSRELLPRVGVRVIMT